MALSNAVHTVAATPQRCFLKSVAGERFAEIAARLMTLRSETLEFVPAYSVKTNPRRELLALAHASHFMAEVISSAELVQAREAFFGPSELIYNGPRCREPAVGDERIFAALADSLEALDRYVDSEVAHFPGVRLRPPSIVSRFGVVGGEVDAAGDALARLPSNRGFAVSMHVRPQDFHASNWFEIVAEVADMGARLERRSRRHCAIFDIGGGWTPAQLDEAIDRDLGRLAGLLSSRLPRADRVLLEPGQGIATAVEVVVCSVLEVRPSRDEVVVDAGFAELPHIAAYSHRMFWACGGPLQPVKLGHARILGPTCLEHDVISTEAALPDGLRAGDRLVIGDCGGYDSSMSFDFAAGTSRWSG